MAAELFFSVVATGLIPFFFLVHIPVALTDIPYLRLDPFITTHFPIFLQNGYWNETVINFILFYVFLCMF